MSEKEVWVVAKPFDPLTDGLDEDYKSENYCHIRLHMRNGKKSLTSVAGLECSPKILEIYLRTWKKNFCCNGCIIEDEQEGIIIQLQGDHRNSVANWLSENNVLSKQNIKIHGF